MLIGNLDGMTVFARVVEERSFFRRGPQTWYVKICGQQTCDEA